MSPYQQFVCSLSDDEVTRILTGEVGISCDAHDYHLIEGGGLSPDTKPAQGAERKWLIESEPQVLEALYSQRALCRAEFDYQAAELMAEHGVGRFSRHPGNRNNMALMIDEWRLIAVGPEDVRSQYGYFCEADESIDEAVAGVRVMRWLKSGDAYDSYRSKTHCRYCQ
jgi:hypothetical protein